MLYGYIVQKESARLLTTSTIIAGMRRWKQSRQISIIAFLAHTRLAVSATINQHYAAGLSASAVFNPICVSRSTKSG